MGVSGFFGRSNLSGLNVAVDLPDEIFAATHIPVKITLLNKRRMLPAFLIRVRIDDKEMLFPFVPAKGAVTKYLDFHFSRRGSYRSKLLYLSSVYPFNFFTRYKAADAVYDAIVFPQVKKCELHGLFADRAAHGGEHYARKYGYEGEMVSIRNYTAGDPSKYIHWKSSAKTGELKTKEFLMASHQPVLIDFERVDIRDMEEKISCIAYFIIKAFRNQIPVGLKLTGKIYKPGLSKTDKIKMLRELALYGES